jgi:hypothetical protein
MQLLFDQGHILAQRRMYRKVTRLSNVKAMFASQNFGSEWKAASKFHA